MMLNKRELEFSKIIAYAHLTDRTCELKHSKEDPAKNHPAVDYLCQYLGDQKTGESNTLLQIPICSECVDAMSDTDWILVYCVNCNESQWIYRPLAKMNYPEGNLVYWLDDCPHCIEVQDIYSKER